MFAELIKAAARLLIQQHPQAFRNQFGEEMQVVLEAKLNDARCAGRPNFVGTCAQEILGLFGSLLVEQWLARGRGEFPMFSNDWRRFHILSLVTPLGLGAVLLIVNPRFLAKLLASGLGWLTAVTFVLAVALIALTLPARCRTPHKTVMAALVAVLAAACVLFGPALVMVLEAYPTLLSLEYAVLAALILADIAIMAVIVAVLRRGGLLRTS